MKNRPTVWAVVATVAATAAATLLVPSAVRSQSPGHDRCRQGFVWREAFPGDHVCVTPRTRQQTADDNRLAASRRGVLRNGPRGPYLCQQGFVWREAGVNDVVCVTPQTRAQAALDNREAPRRVAGREVPIDEGTRLNPVRE